MVAHDSPLHVNAPSIVKLDVRASKHVRSAAVDSALRVVAIARDGIPIGRHP